MAKTTGMLNRVVRSDIIRSRSYVRGNTSSCRLFYYAARIPHGLLFFKRSSGRKNICKRKSPAGFGAVLCADKDYRKYFEIGSYSCSCLLDGCNHRLRHHRVLLHQQMAGIKSRSANCSSVMNKRWLRPGQNDGVIAGRKC